MLPDSRQASPRFEDVLASSWLATVLVLAAALLPYSGTLNAPFVFDDIASVVNNESIRDLSSWRVLTPSGMRGAGVESRPLVNVSLALNYAVSGLNPWSYHLLNSLLHAGSALLLLGILRRSLPLALSSARPEADRAAAPLALGITLLWAAHPLLTETVTCIIQRTEGLSAFFILLSLYCFIRARSSTRIPSQRWLTGSVLACAAGMLAKELVAVLPVFILLFDRQLFASGFAQALRERRAYYCGLLSSYGCLVLSMSLSPERGGSVGLGLGMSSWHYALTQCEAITRYLWLCVWPHPLALDYGNAVVTDPFAVGFEGLIVLGLLAASLLALVRRWSLGLAGAWFLGILAPSSSFIPLTTQTIAEHRMYLPSIAVLLVLGLLLQRLFKAQTARVCLGLTLVLASLTAARNLDYRSGLALWQDTVDKRPANPRAQFNLANALLAEGRTEDALQHYQRTIELCRDEKGKDLIMLGSAHYNLGCAKLQIGDLQSALGAFEQTLKLKHDHVDALINQAEAFKRLKRTHEAMVTLEKALGFSPRDVGVRLKLADLLVDMNQHEQAIAHYQTAISLNPGQPATHAGLAMAYIATQRAEEALVQLKEAARLDPGNPSIETNTAIALLMLQRMPDACAKLEGVLKRTPDYRPARELLEQIRR